MTAAQWNELHRLTRVVVDRPVVRWRFGAGELTGKTLAATQELQRYVNQLEHAVDRVATETVCIRIDGRTSPPPDDDGARS